MDLHQVGEKKNSELDRKVLCNISMKLLSRYIKIVKFFIFKMVLNNNAANSAKTEDISFATFYLNNIEIWNLALTFVEDDKISLKKFTLMSLNRIVYEWPIKNFNYLFNYFHFKVWMNVQLETFHKNITICIAKLLN